ncbi:hypothetical protein IW137_001070 [Coemansia sp. RSA 1287]|nr:hypothetical protein GGH98_002007 [Coemansia sp. RSA 454]KAJ2445272.1 hypothetical protein IWW46_001575 [Coemansia sp. RSA 2440]KAJ2649412.1 hypothetical protein IW137_001070 [Coemansia sp. RSA 1287]
MSSSIAMLGTSGVCDASMHAQATRDDARSSVFGRHCALGTHQPFPDQQTKSFKEKKPCRESELYKDPDAHSKPDSRKETEPSFYSEEVDRFAALDQQPVTLHHLLETCAPPLTRSKLLANAQFLARERPVRYAKRVKLFQRLPYIVNLNPHIHNVYQAYYANFIESQGFSRVENMEDEHKFISMLARQSKLLLDIMPQIARGFYECRHYFRPDDRRRFLDQLIKMRIGLRLLTSQHIALYDQFHAKTTVSAPTKHAVLADPTHRHQGIIDNQLHVTDMVHICAQSVQAMCDMTFGDSPSFIVDGQTDVVFRYIPSHLDYMLTELLKNAFCASLKSVQDTENEIPPVIITVSKGDSRVAIRVRDQGGGIPSQIHDQVFDYSFTTTKHTSFDDPDNVVPSDGSNCVADANVISGLGFGLPMTKIYAEYFGGMLNIVSLEGYGCDAFLELPSIKLNRTPTIQI